MLSSGHKGLSAKMGNLRSARDACTELFEAASELFATDKVESAIKNARKVLAASAVCAYVFKDPVDENGKPLSAMARAAQKRECIRILDRYGVALAEPIMARFNAASGVPAAPKPKVAQKGRAVGAAAGSRQR